VNNLINDLRLEAEMKIEEIKEQVAAIDWAALLRTVILAIVAFFKADWSTYIETAARYIVKAAVWVYVAGYFLGAAVHKANEKLSQFAIWLLVDQELQLAKQ